MSNYGVEVERLHFSCVIRQMWTVKCLSHNKKNKKRENSVLADGCQITQMILSLKVYWRVN